MATLQVYQKLTGELQPVDRKGNPAQVQAGSVLFSSSDESVFTIEIHADNELRVNVVAVAPGVATLNYSADADLGDGVQSISGFTAIEVQKAGAVGFGVVFGEPADIEALPVS